MAGLCHECGIGTPLASADREFVVSTRWALESKAWPSGPGFLFGG